MYLKPTASQLTAHHYVGLPLQPRAVQLHSCGTLQEKLNPSQRDTCIYLSCFLHMKMFPEQINNTVSVTGS